MSEISEEGEVLALALDVLRKHLESHECSECLDSYQTAIKAVTAWVNKEAQPKNLKEGSHVKESESEKEGPQKETVDVEGKIDTNVKKPAWDIF